MLKQNFQQNIAEIKTYAQSDFAICFELVKICADIHNAEVNRLLRDYQHNNIELTSEVLKLNMRLRDMLNIAKQAVEQLEQKIFAT